MRILKGFGTAFLFSTTLTVVATAASALAGVGLAVSLATISVVTSITISAIQINKWRQAQQAAGKPANLTALLQDKRMLASLGTTALASIAMIFGAAGLTQAATALGFGAMALGGSNNALALYKDAKNKGFSTKESLVWGLANAAAVVTGGVLGRTAANAGINAYNEHNPENTLFQNKEVHNGVRHEQTTVEHEAYNDDALKNAERITKMWYQDNPGELQHRVDLINQYNADHGTNIDPYRAIMLSADAGGHTFDNMGLHVDGGGVVHSHGQHTVMTDAWGEKYGFSHDELMAMRNMFQADGTVNPAGIDAAMRADHIVSSINEVGALEGSRPHYDGVLHQNTVDANGTPVFDTYANGASVFHTETQVIINDVPYTDVSYVPVDVPWTMGTVGAYHPHTTENNDLKDRIGGLADQVKVNRKRVNPRPEPVPPLPPKPKPKPLPPVPPKPLPPVPPKPKPLPPVPPLLPILPEQEPDYIEALAMEYDTFQGTGAWDALSPERKQHYENMVREEWTKEPDPAAYVSFNDYIMNRLYKFDEQIRTIIDPVNRRSNKQKEFEAVAKTRQDIMKSNADFRNITLQDFGFALDVSMSNDHTRDILRTSQDSKKGPVEHKRRDMRFKKGTMVLQDKIVQYEKYLKEKKAEAKRLQALNAMQGGKE